MPAALFFYLWKRGTDWKRRFRWFGYNSQPLEVLTRRG